MLAAARASRRCRRTKRSVSAAWSSGRLPDRRWCRRPTAGPADAGNSRQARGRWRCDRPGDLRRQRQGPSRRPGSGSDPGDQPAEQARRAGAPHRRRARMGAARIVRRSTGRAPRARRRQARARPPDQPTKPEAVGDAAATRPGARSGADRAGREARARVGRQWAADGARAGARTAKAAHDVGRFMARDRGGRRPRRSRHRRVGETNWTVSSSRTNDRMSQAMMLFGQNASRATPNGATSAGA